MPENSARIYLLVVLTSINLVNYLDRFIISALLPLISADLHLTDAQLGFLHTAFTFSYALAAPFLGFLGDRMDRKWLASATVFLWSLATGFSGLARSYGTLLGVRACVGIGEAGYGPVSPTLISDSYSEKVRSRILSIYYIGTPVGGALGYILGGHLGHRFGWRTAFLVAAVPGLLLAVMALFIKEPRRHTVTVEHPSFRETLVTLARTRSFVLNVLGTAALTFATVGLAYWFPTFLSRMRGWKLQQATQVFGAITVMAGIAGTLFGGFIADLWHKENRKAYFYVAAIGMLLAVPLSICALFIHNKAWISPFVFLTEFFLFFNISPLNAAIISVVHPRMRATAMAMNILLIHVLGDAVSTLVIGKISDITGSLTAGMMIGPIAIMAGGLILILGAGQLVRDQDRMRTMMSKL